MALETNKNTYVSLSDANEYFDTKLHADAWIKATDTDKEKALIEACRLMNTYRYVGYQVYSTQELAFPRVNIGRQPTDIEMLIYGASMNTIPNDIKYAQMEQAFYLLEGPSEARKLAIDGLSSFSAGGASMSFNTNEFASNLTLSPLAKHYLEPYLSHTGVIK